MSATNHTSNYNLPIYEAGNTANWLVDFNGAMSTIDGALNENKLAGDTLKTDMEELQTDFQQVSTKADAAEQAASQASTNAANALTIANNATTIAGDAQVDAHSIMEAYTKTFKNKTVLTIKKTSFIPNTDYTGRIETATNELMDYTEMNICLKPSAYSKIEEISYKNPSTASHFYRFKPSNNLYNMLNEYDYWKMTFANTSNGEHYYVFAFMASVTPNFTNYQTTSQNCILCWGLLITKTDTNIKAELAFGTLDVLTGTNTAFIIGYSTNLHIPNAVMPKLTNYNDNIYTLDEIGLILEERYPHLIDTSDKV